MPGQVIIWFSNSSAGIPTARLACIYRYSQEDRKLWARPIKSVEYVQSWEKVLLRVGKNGNLCITNSDLDVDWIKNEYGCYILSEVKPGEVTYPHLSKPPKKE